MVHSDAFHLAERVAREALDEHRVALDECGPRRLDEKRGSPAVLGEHTTVREQVER
jgi:hypothetical protein